MLYFANPSTPAIKQQMVSGRLACIITPRQGNRRPSGSAWCVDNGCGPGKDGKAGAGYPGDNKYLGMLQDLWWAEGSDPCDPDTSDACFAVAPDVLGDAGATLKRSRHMLGWIRHIGFPTALVAQNGLEDLPVPWDDFDVLFLGGDTAWKLGPAARDLTAQAKARGKWVHMGRVNSLRRLRYADAIGCDSADGTKLTRAPDLHLPTVLGWDRAVNDQGALFDL
ncbi:MAG: hypothetical protein JWO67_2258, partial [Streptosporangiaceae bacterium]|nr:hypothetical protein [Streptosporangiaceae bacterium]